MEGRRIGRYVVGPEIAWGGMASVHLGRMIGPKGFGKTVALKRLRSQYAADPDFVKMFHDEARVTSGLTHANVVMTLDVVEDNDDLFLVMEYVHGASLAQISRVAASKGPIPIPIPISAAIIAGMLDGLFAAHEATDENGEHLNVIHRDVSPQNVLVTFEGVPKLADFGIAKAVGRAHSTADGSAKGKVSYMAPEQVLSEPVTALSDVYAAGVVLWECLTNQRLIDGRSTAECLRTLIDLEVVKPSTHNPKIPADLDAVVMRALQRSPQKRFKSAREMAAALRKSVEVAHTNELADWIRANCAELKEQRDKGLTNLQRVLGSSGLTSVGIDSSSSLKTEEETPGSKGTPSGSASSTPPDESTKKPGAVIFGTPRWLVLTVFLFLSLSVAGVLFAVVGMRQGPTTAATPTTTTATTTATATAASSTVLSAASAPSTSGSVEVAGPAIEIVEAPAKSSSSSSSSSSSPSSGKRVSMGAAPPGGGGVGKKKCKIVTSTDSSGHTKFTEVCN